MTSGNILPKPDAEAPLHDRTSAQGLGCTISNVRDVYALDASTWMCKVDLTFDDGSVETVDYCARVGDAMATGQWVVARITAGKAGPIGTVEAWDALQAAKPLPVPASVSMRQARIALSRAGLLAAAEAAIQAMPGQAGEEARIEWEYAASLDRNHPMVEALGAAIGLDGGGLDDIFRAAATI